MDHPHVTTETCVYLLRLYIPNHSQILKVYVGHLSSLLIKSSLVLFIHNVTVPTREIDIPDDQSWYNRFSCSLRSYRLMSLPWTVYRRLASSKNFASGTTTRASIPRGNSGVCRFKIGWRAMFTCSTVIPFWAKTKDRRWTTLNALAKPHRKVHFNSNYYMKISIVLSHLNVALCNGVHLPQYIQALMFLKHQTGWWFLPYSGFISAIFLLHVVWPRSAQCPRDGVHGTRNVNMWVKYFAEIGLRSVGWRRTGFQRLLKDGKNRHLPSFTVVLADTNALGVVMVNIWRSVNLR